MINKVSKNLIRKRKHERTRKHVAGTPERPRLAVFRSNKQMYAQIIDDSKHQTLVTASTLDKALREQVTGSNIEAAKAVGKLVAERALEKGIETVVFDRSGYVYHGRVAALAEASREAGLKF